MAAVDYDGKDGDVGGIDAWNARSLGERFGSPFLQLLAALETYRWASIIVKPIRDARILVALRPFRRQFLLTNVPFIAADDSNLLNHWIGKPGKR